MSATEPNGKDHLTSLAPVYRWCVPYTLTIHARSAAEAKQRLADCLAKAGILVENTTVH